jgi:hypothetical protein
MTTADGGGVSHRNSWAFIIIIIMTIITIVIIITYHHTYSTCTSTNYS